MGVRCQKCEIPADAYTMMVGSSICELCQFEEGDPSPETDPARTCQVCGDKTEVTAIQVSGDELQVCGSCRQKYFAGPGAVATC